MLAGAGGGALLGAGLGHTLGSDTDYVNQAQTVFGGALGTTLGGVIGHTAGGFIGAKKYNKHIADHGTLDHKPITKTDKKHIDASNHMSNHIATGASLGSLSGVALRLLSGAGVLGDDMKHMANDTPSFAYGGTGALLGGGVGAITGKMTSRK